MKMLLWTFCWTATRFWRLLMLAATLAMVSSTKAENVTFEWVTVGDPGNLGDGEQGGVGAVDYVYRIGKYEVTNTQYLPFLNAAARAEFVNPDRFLPDGIELLRGTGPETDPYEFGVKAGFENKPVNNVGFGGAFHFANWLELGQPQIASPELVGSGAYTPATTTGGGERIPGANYFVPSFNEWYKAAYYDPTTESYFDFATSSNEVPYSVPAPGTAAPDPSNTANVYINDFVNNGYNEGYAVTGTSELELPFSQIYLTDVGAYPLAVSPYGTYDQTGSVWEWTEGYGGGLGGNRNVTGGGWATTFPELSSIEIMGGYVMNGSDPSFLKGFRIASIVVPEPSAEWLLITGFVALFMPRLRRGQPSQANDERTCLRAALCKKHDH